MITTKLYQSDRYLKEWDAVITSVSDDKDNNDILIITMDQTAFFPEGGGQSCDVGSISGFDVIDVQEHDDEVFHTVLKASRCNVPYENTLYPGAPVKCTLDWERRFDNMQRHCGEHILSGIFYSMFGGINRGFHMGQDYMTIDISLEENPAFTEITYEMAIAAQNEANKVIWSDAPVTVLRFDSREEAEKMPLRKKLAFDEDISIVSVGSVENAADCVACCGTHPSTAGQVGLIKIYKTEKYKNMFRIYFEAGKRALLDYNIKHDILTNLSNKYSSSIEDFPQKLQVQEEKLAAIKDELFHIKKALIENQCEKLDKILINAGKVVIYPLYDLSMDDAFSMAKRYIGKVQTLIMLYIPSTTSYVLISDGSVNCGALVKEYASFYSGKGGGSNTSARAIFSNDTDAKLFSDLITNHLKG